MKEPEGALLVDVDLRGGRQWQGLQPGEVLAAVGDDEMDLTATATDTHTTTATGEETATATATDIQILLPIPS